jgi:uncharacterized protein YbjT (DUF2867 family)
VTAVLINGTNYGTPAGQRGAQHARVIRAAAQAGIPRIVYTSWPDPHASVFLGRCTARGRAPPRRHAHFSGVHCHPVLAEPTDE